MIAKLIQLVIAVVVVGLIFWFLSWVMVALALPAMVQTVIWIIFGLILLVAVVGLLGYGPLKGTWNSPP